MSNSKDIMTVIVLINDKEVMRKDALKKQFNANTKTGIAQVGFNFSGLADYEDKKYQLSANVFLPDEKVMP
jgi:hypothetical protein